MDKTMAWMAVCLARLAADSTIDPHQFWASLSTRNWMEAMELEYDTLIKNGTSHLVSPHSGVNIIDPKLIFKVKLHTDGKIERYKVWLVAKGLNQRYCLDYEDPFSPMVKHNTIWLLLFLVVNRGWTFIVLMFRTHFYTVS
jgi:hypothetical protein